MDRMYRLGPEYIDVTWGAGGTTSDLTVEICTTAQQVHGLETSMHLTCTNMPKEKIDIALKQAKQAGIQNILALRGDPPRGQENWEKCENGFSYAVDLVKYIKEQYGDYFCISVAGYPEGHIDSGDDKEIDIQYLKEKVDAGAEYIVTQLFYDVPLFLKWVQKCRKAGINVPIVPGIMPIQSYNGFKRMTTLSKTIVPQFIQDSLDPIKDDDQAVKDYGVQLAIDMCKQILNAGITGFHFYTLNLEKSARLILEGLQFVNPAELYRPLPWNPSLAKNRENESVRPIFWKNRTQSYISRTEQWDDFPNGRWGDSRSPAYGELDGYGISLKFNKQQALDIWDHPTTVEQLSELFAKYCQGKVSALPWCDQSLDNETRTIENELVQTNHLGFLTINSQPSVNGAKSSDRVFGWGPKNGYVYQKAYIEFFCSPEKLSVLIDEINKNPQVTYYAVNKRGDLKTNNQIDGPIAVTWGVFPGREIAQPTIVEASSFMAWKDEAFELWSQWGKLYDSGSDSEKLFANIRDNWFLVNVVDNDFTSSNKIFEIFGITPSYTENGSAAQRLTPPLKY